MSTDLMYDPSQPPPEDGVVENLLDTSTAKAVVLEMEFRPISGKGDSVRKKKRFPTSAAAQEYMTNALPQDPRHAIGSPKQALARRARFLGLDPKWLADHNLICHLTTENNNAAVSGRGTGSQSAGADGLATGTERPAGGSPVHAGPPPIDLLGSIALGEPLSDEEAELSESGGDEAEDSGEESES